MNSIASWPDTSTLIPELLGKLPQARTVLDRYGLRGCGGQKGPAETLGFFARAHDVPITRLLENLRHEPLAAAATARCRATGTGRRYLPAVFKAGIGIVLSLGGAWGVYLLGRIAISGSFTSAGVQEVNAHGAYYGATRHAITVGFISLMIVGVSAKVVPTLNGVAASRLSPLWFPFVLINTGCTLRVAGQTLTGFWTGAFGFAGVSGLLEVSGLAIWGVHLWRVMSGRAKPNLMERECGGTAVAEGAIGPHSTVAGALDRDPLLIDTFVAYGFKMLANPRVRRSIARIVTIEQACRRMDVDCLQFVEALNQKQAEHFEQAAGIAKSEGGEVDHRSHDFCCS